MPRRVDAARRIWSAATERADYPRRAMRGAGSQAMAAGATLAATLAAVAGRHGWTFALLTLIALCIGRIRRFGRQGTQVAIVGFFAFFSGQGQIDCRLSQRG
ncbi:hypothetical protein ACFWBN_05745 [Streptomyces sp. NPDC059989]|uniref:hypothetical protein n=1 Tax=Streptomyces sp. NPDC059989 TaxID=3347026 RepID=UPI0036776A83